MVSQLNYLPFVGRQSELKQFREMVDSKNKYWLLWVVGPAGQGKSKVLEACLTESDKLKLKHSGIFDFFNDGLRTRWGVLTELAKRFKVENNPQYRDAVQQYELEITKGETADPYFLQHALDKVEEALIYVLLPKRSGKPRIIFVDTVEVIVESIGNWLFEKFFPKLYPHYRIVAGGRKIATINIEAESWQGHQPDVILLGGLNIPDIYDYFRIDGLIPAIEPFINDIHRLTSGDGQALLVALTARALKDGELDPNELSTISQREFERKLVIEPLRLERVENPVILELAHIYHGFTPTTLALRYSLEKLGVSSHKTFLQSLTRYPYIKFHPDTGATRLHDYFRERVLKELWPEEIDPVLTVRSAVSKQMAAYFEQSIQNIETNKPSTPSELETLQHQLIYHLLFSDRERAYSILWELLDESWHAFKYDYMNSLLDMANEVNNALRLVGKFDGVLDSLEKAARSWMGLEVWETDRSIKLADEVILNSAGVTRFKLTAIVAKATALARKGKIDESVQMLREAFDGYNKLLEIAEKAENGDVIAKESLSTEHGITTVHGILPERYLILNTIGVILRNIGRYDEAEKEFNKSYELSRIEGNLPWQASAATQLGTILRYKGDFATAYDRIHQGLAWRQKIGQRGREAYSLQALGMLERDGGNLGEARRYLLRAYNIWNEFKADVDMASVLRNLAWVDYLEKKFDDAESRYNQANEIYKRKKLERELPNLREKQAVLAISRAKDSATSKERLMFLEKAEAYLQESASLGDIHNQPLYSALSAVDLCLVAEMKEEYEKIPPLAMKLKKYEEAGYHFEPAFADLEEILGRMIEHKARQETEINYQLFDEATDHYCEMFVYLARFSSHRYRLRREFLRNWLPSLPDDLRHRACNRLIERWNSQPNDLALHHPGIISTARAMDEL